MDRNPNQADQHPTERLAADETTIALAWQEQVAQAQSSARLAAELRQAPPTLYRRFAAAYGDLLALSRARRRKLLRSMGMTLAGAALAFALALGQVPVARAASIGVGGSCTLVDAITAANTDTATGGCVAGSGADTIILAGGTYTLTTVNSVSYGTNGLPVITSAITIEGNGATIARDAGAPAFRILEVASSGNLTLNDTTISGGQPDSVRNYSIDFSGGGIINRGTLTINNSTISDNSATFEGGGIFNASGSTLTMTGSTVSGNSTSVGGGLTNVSTMTLANSTVSGNSASTRAGGIRNAGTLTLTNSTVSGNSAFQGGGFDNYDTVILERSLISGNSASISPEIHNYYSTIISNNYNLIGYSSSARSSGFSPSGSDIVPSQALSAILNTTLQNNGGDTFTHALVSCSPAVDATPTGPAADQRGVIRPQGAAFDIGAFELESPASCNTAPVATNDSYSTNEDTALNVPAPGVLGNDSDADSDPLTAVLVSGPTNGTLTLNPDGSFSYTPNANFSGSDSFSYKANDGTADSNVATVSLTVVSALDQIDELIAAVEALVDNGSLNGGQGNALITKLEHAADYVDNGQEAQAISRMQTFISQVNSFIGSGVLTSAEGQPLIDKANAIIQSLGG